MKDKGIEEILNSSEHIQKVNVSADLMMRLKRIPEQVQSNIYQITKRVLWVAAASISLLIAANIYASLNYSPETTDQNNVESHAFSYMNTI